MSSKILIKIEPEEVSSDPIVGVGSDWTIEQHGQCSMNPNDAVDNFVGIKQETTDIKIKLEAVDQDVDPYEEALNPESVLMKLEHHFYESNDTISRLRRRHVSYKEDDSDDDYRPQNRTVKKRDKKLQRFQLREPNVKPLFKGRSKKDDLTYSDEIISNIEIVTIDEQTRQNEHHELLNARKHMNYVCEPCALGFVVREAYCMHLKIHSPESGEHECDICGAWLKSEDVLYRHKLRHYRRYRCGVCRLRLRDKDAAAAHVMREHVRAAFVCRHCGRDFKRPQYLKRHVEQMHTKPLRLECPVCQRVFHERGWYRCHVRTHNAQVKASVSRKAVCSHCGREFRNKQYLARHLAVHEGRSPAACHLCSRTFKNAEVLRVHKRQHHGKNPARDYATADGFPSPGIPRLSADTTCSACGRVLTTRAMLARHTQRMHTERIRKFQCDYCQKWFFSKAEVRSHIVWTHLRRRRHACACGRAFRTPARLRAHAAHAHLRLQPPRDKSCSICGKNFANQQVLTRHVKGHSGETYPCTACGRNFKTQSYVKIHYQIKHLNMTRAQVKAQSKRKLIMVDNADEVMNVNVKIGKKSNLNVEDPLSINEGDAVPEAVVKREIPDAPVPLFETFVDIQREC